MSFADRVKGFTDKVKADIEHAQQRAIENGKLRLVEILGEDAQLITSLKLDTDVGKFYDITAPDHVVEKLRASGLVRE